MNDLYDNPYRLNELLNIAHDRPFSLLFGNYSWLLGMAGGVALVWLIVMAQGVRRDNPVSQLAMPVCGALIAAGFLNVLAEVQQPARLLYGYLYGWNYWDTAIIKYGITILPLFLACSWWLTFQCLEKSALQQLFRKVPEKFVPLAEFITLWSRHYNIFKYRALRRSVYMVVAFCGLFAPLYSGVFLMYEHGVPVWNSPAQVLLFLSTSIAMGAVFFMIFGPSLYRVATGEQAHLPKVDLRWLALAALLVSFVVWFGWMWWIKRLGTLPDQQLSALFAGPYHNLILWNWEIIGLLLPLLLLATPLGNRSWARWIAGIAILWGSYAIRFIVLVGGQALNRSGAGYLSFGLSDDVIWYSAFSLLFFFGLLALLLLLPYGQQRSTDVMTGEQS